MSLMRQVKAQTVTHRSTVTQLSRFLNHADHRLKTLVLMVRTTPSNRCIW